MDVLADNPIESHIFCDASEKACRAVAYMRLEDGDGKVQVAFVMARSRVAPKKQLPMPRLELCTALSGARGIAPRADSTCKETNTVERFHDCSALDPV